MSQPDASGASGTPVAAEGKRRRTRWPLLVAGLIGGVGLLAIVGNALLLIYQIQHDEPAAWDLIPWRYKVWEIEFRVGAMLVGVFLIMAAVEFARRLWWAAVIWFVIAITFLQIHPAANRFMRHQFNGDSFEIPAAKAARR